MSGNEMAGHGVIEAQTFQGKAMASPFNSGNGIYKKCVFDSVTFLRAENCVFHDCVFTACVFSGPQISANFSGVEFVGCVFDGGVFGNIRMSGVLFRAGWLHKVEFRRSASFSGVTFEGSGGLWRCRGLELVQVDDDAASRLPLDDALSSCPLPSTEKVASWERLRTFGWLPLFGVSFSALVAIPAVAFGVAAYNQQIGRLGELATRGGVDALSPPLGAMLRQLQPISLPTLTFWLLISTFLLGCASLIYSLLCPARIKEFSLERWTDELRQSALHYLPLSWRYRWMRVLAFAFYVAGGIGTAGILLVKLWNAAEFIISNTTLPWYLW